MSLLREIFETLTDYYESKPPMLWWPDNPFEVIVGAVLVQGTTWKSVAQILQQFRIIKLFDFKKIVETEDEQLAQTIRPAGLVSRKVKYLKAVSQLFLDKADGDITHFFARNSEEIRGELLAVPGIGAGTADNILLYAGNLPIYMVDTFTRRIFTRHGITGQLAKDVEIQKRIHDELTPIEEPCEAKLYSKFQELVVRIGRDFCDKSRPNCPNCPLRPFLPEQEKETTTEPNVSAPKPERKTEKNPAVPNSVTELPPGLDDNERKIVEAIGGEVRPIDTVVEMVGLPVHIVRATIAVLQMKKIVKQTEGNQVKRI